MMADINFSSEQAILSAFPMPPSSNHLYVSFVRNGKNIRKPSKELNQYKKQMEKWKFINLLAMQKLHHWMEYEAWQHDLKAERLYRLDRYFCFPYSKIWTKEGKPKKLDASNRIKAFDDCFCDMIGVDDKRIWSGVAEKVTLEETRQPCVIVKIRPIRSKDWKGLINSLHLNQDI